MKSYKKVLSIAGSDSGGGAGIQADIKTISALGCYASTAITALTCQNTLGVSAIHIPPAETVAGQVRAVLGDIGADAIKTGMLPTEPIISTIADLLRAFGSVNVVVDPVMVATSGSVLVPDDAARAIIEKMLPIATLITPNIPEAEFMTGVRIASERDFPKAAKALMKLGAKNVLLKAGHMKGNTLTDHLYTPEGLYTYTFERINTPNTHGTGCTLSSAIAACLALGHDLEQAVSQAAAYLHKAIASGTDYLTGSGHGPVNHFFNPIPLE